MRAIPIVNPLDRRNAVIASAVTLLLLFLYLIFSTIEMADPAPSDIEPIKTETTLQEIELKEYIVESPSGGKAGGSGTDDPISKNLEQTKQILTSDKGRTSVVSGKSTNHTSPNSDNPSATDKNGDDLGFGDDYNKGDSGFDNDFNNISIGKEGKNSIKEGTGRIRIEDADLSDLTVTNDKNCISLILTIDKNGNVINVEKNQTKTTVNKATIVNKVISRVKAQVKYNKANYDNPARVYLTYYIKQI